MFNTLLLFALPSDLDRRVYPMAPAIHCPTISVDVKDYPQGKEWGQRAKILVEEWFGKVTQLLATSGMDPLTGKRETKPWNPPKVIRLVIKKNIEPPAYESDGTITIKGPWITAHPEDFGMVIHELTHVIQSYPGAKTTPGWLVEGVADYVRWWRYEPEAQAGARRVHLNPGKSKLSDGYGTTAFFLAWTSYQYSMTLVPALDFAMRNGRDPMPIFRELTSKSADELWDEFIHVQVPSGSKTGG